MNEPIVVLKNATVVFAQAHSAGGALNGIDLAVASGEWLGIVGKNGSGKSTLAQVIASVCPLSKGVVSVPEGRVQLLFQNPEAQIVGETVYEEVCFGMEVQAVDPVQMPERAQASLAQVGLDVPLDHPVNHLSGGQKQLLNLAGCLAVKAQVLVFDEATSMLDPASRERVLEIAHDLRQSGHTIIWVTQYMEELAHADRVLALDAGCVAFVGEREAFFRQVDERISVCEQMGFTQPYAVQVAQHLQALGMNLAFLPVSTKQLVEAVTGA